MSRRSDEDLVVVPERDEPPRHAPKHAPRDRPDETVEPIDIPERRWRLPSGLSAARLEAARRRATAGMVGALPRISRIVLVLGVIALLFVSFVLVFGAMRHTTRQEHLEEAFRTRVSRGHADGPNWRPLPGQAIATISIPAIDLYEVVVHDTTPQLLEGGPGHLLGTPLPGHAGNAVVFGRRITDGAPFRNLAELSPGDPITVVTPAGVFRYEVVDVSRVPPGDRSVLSATPEARLTLITAGSWFVPRDRLVVAASLDGSPIVGAPVPQVELRDEQLGGSGDSSAIVPLIPWLLLLIAIVVAWPQVRRRLPSRGIRLAVLSPVVLLVLFFVFENAEDLLPGAV